MEKECEKKSNASTPRLLLAHPHVGMCLASVATWTINPRARQQCPSALTMKTETMNSETLALQSGIDLKKKKRTERDFAECQ